MERFVTLDRFHTPGPSPAFQVLLAFLAFSAGHALSPPPELVGQERCPAAADPEVVEGWEAFRDGNLREARERFTVALDRCPDHPGGRTGLAYVDLREGRDPEARRALEEVLDAHPESVDALSGLGILAWRRGDLTAVSQRFRKVLEIDPENTTALEYLGRLPPGLGRPPPRPPFVRPDTLVYPARARGDALEVRGPGGWEPFYVKGVNLGAALPGKNPSEFPDSSTYVRWIRDMAEMGANTIRVYTIHPPHFYSALREFNLRHPREPLWLLHGVWAELPPEDNYLDPEWEGAFFEEMRRVVDLLHGRADIRPRPGHASGFYTADVSPWVLGFVLGREWEPFSVLGFQNLHPDFRGWEGEFVTVRGGNAMDAWTGRAVEETVRYEVETYHAQRPVSYTNWPTLDPLHHPTETTVAEEVAIRRALGEEVRVEPREYDNDAIGLDATLLEPSEAFPAGVFATFHAYPYYPDFMVLSPDYADAASTLGPSDYFGYLRELKEHHRDMPVIIAEYGVPASLGIAHFQPQGWHHGGHSEEEMAAIDRRLTLEIAEAGMAGGAVFAWIDEWFKKNWIVLEFEIPLDRNRLWLNRLDAEQHYGMIAMEPGPRLPGGSFQRRLEGWRSLPPLYGDPSGEAGERGSLRAFGDEAYLWLHVALPVQDSPVQDSVDQVFLGFDLVDPARGDVRWPGNTGPGLPVGVEYALRIEGDEARLLVDPPQNPFRLQEVGADDAPGGVREWHGSTDVPGFFQARAEQRFNRPYRSVFNRDGVYDSLRVITNRRRFFRDSTEVLAMGYDRGILPAGEPPDGLWSRSSDGRDLEIRIPWMLLNFTDPSRRRLLQGGEGGDSTAGAGSLPTRTVEEIRLVLAFRHSGGEWTRWPERGEASDAAVFSWPTWEEPSWVGRKRPVFDAMAETFRQLEGWDPRGASSGTFPWSPAVAGPEGPLREPGEGEEAQEIPDPQRADSAWHEGDTETATRLYRAILASDSSHVRALHRLALLSAWDEGYEEALSLFGRLLEVAPENLEARVDRARVLAWRGDLGEAIEALNRVLEDHPDSPRALEARAQFQSWTGEYREALSSYDRLLSLSPDPTGVLLAQARVLGWASRLEDSRAVYDSILAVNPRNLEARLGLARLLALSDQTGKAVARYRRILKDHPDHPEARRGLARALTWGGLLPEGEEAWRWALEASPQDVAARVGLAQNLRWQGRNAAAGEILRDAGEEQRRNPDVQEQLRWVRAALGPRARVVVVDEGDSDDNAMTTTRLSGRWNPLPRVSLEGEVYYRDLEQKAIDLSRRSWGTNLSASLQVEPGWVFEVGVGGTRTDGAGTTSFTALQGRVASPGRYPFGGTLLLHRTPLDATARLVERGVRMDLLDVSGRWTPGPGWQLSASGGVGSFRGQETNRRVHLSGRIQRSLGGGWTMGLGHRYFSFQDDLDEFYFDPDYFGLTELLGRWTWDSGRWRLLLEAAPGAQKIRSQGELTGALRASARLSFRVSPGREVSLSGGYSSAGVQSFSTADADYRYRAFILGGSWVF